MDNEKRKLEKKTILRNKMKKIEPKLQDVINYLKDHPNLLRNEKNPYTAERLMMLLDNEKLAALEDEFNEHPNGIELANFIWLMKCAIVHPVEEKYELVTGLIKLFQDIDINGDKRMEWSEFTQYIIDAVIGEKEARFFDARFEKERELTETEIIDKAYSRKTKRYVQSKFFDNSTHSNLIKKIIYCQHSDILFSLEQSSNTLKFYTSECMEKIVNKKKLCLVVPTEFNKVSFIIDFAVAEALNTVAVVTSKKQIIFWEANLSQKLIKSQKLDVLQTGIWYLSLHKIWVTAGDDFNLKTWIFTPSMSTGDNKRFKLSHDKLLKAHKKKIMDIVELTAPRIVASASLDGKIKLWDLSDLEPRLLTELRDPQNCERGVRQLTYSHNYGSNLLSVGFEQHINIWCPEISITRAFIGRLEGHSSLVVLCKFIPFSPNVISIDDKCNIRIWDIRSMSTIQVISTDGGYSLVTEMCFVMGKFDRFILAGKRLTYFENAEIQKNMKNANDEIYPINVDFNIYFNQIIVLTKVDMRLYDAMTGRLKKVFNEIHDDKYSVELSMFCFGARQRKFFLADNGGMIRQYNMKNSEFLKKVNDVKEIEDSEFSKKQSHIKKKETNEVSALLYITAEKLLIASYWDSTIRIYDEQEAEESVLLKVLSGAHKDSEILCLSYSAKQSLLASGSANGIVALWDFEIGKLEGILKIDDLEVIQIEFLDPYPAIITAASNGCVYIWGSRMAPTRYKYKALIKIVNTLWVEGVETIVPVHSILSENSIIEGFQRQSPADGFEPPEIHSFNPIIQKKLASEKTLKAKKFNFLGGIPNSEESFTNLNGGNGNHSNQLHFRDEIQLSPIKLRDQGQPNIDIMTSPKKDLGFRETNESFQRYWNTYESSLKSNKNPYCYAYVGDAKGLVQIWNLTDILHSRQIFPVQDERKKQNFQLRRKDLINATKAAENMMSGQERKNSKNILSIHAVNGVLLKRWSAHTALVNKMVRIQEPPTIFSCSHDKTVKIWYLDGTYLSKINLVAYDKPNQWVFPYDWVHQKLDDLDMVFDSLKVIENEQLLADQKEKVKMKYLTNKYFAENEHQDLQKAVIQQEIPEVNEKQKKKIEEDDEEIGIKIKYDVKPQPSLQDEFQQILLKFEQEKEEEDNRLKRLAMQEKEQEQVDFDQIKKYYNIDKYAKEINTPKIFELNNHFNQVFYPQDEENIIITPQLQTILHSPTKEPGSAKNAGLGVEKIKLKPSVSNFKLKPPTKILTSVFPSSASTNNLNPLTQSSIIPLNAVNPSSVSKISTEQITKQNQWLQSKPPHSNYLGQQLTSSGGSLPAIQSLMSQSQVSQGAKKAQEIKQTREVFFRKTANFSISSSSQKRKIFSLSTANFLKNNAFVSSITKHLQPKTADDEKFKPQIDVKYKLGEFNRCYRVAQYRYVNSVASDSPQILFADNDLLQLKMKTLKQLNAKKNMEDDDDDDFQDMEDSEGDKTEDPTVLHSRNARRSEDKRQNNDDSQSMGQSIGFSSFMSKQKSNPYFNK